MAITNGFTAGISDIVTPGTFFTDYITGQLIVSSYIIIPTTGTEGGIVYLDPAQQLRYWPFAFLGYNPISAVQILASATVNGTPRTTTATPLYWVGAYNT